VLGNTWLVLAMIGWYFRPRLAHLVGSLAPQVCAAKRMCTLGRFSSTLGRFSQRVLLHIMQKSSENRILLDLWYLLEKTFNRMNTKGQN